MKDSWQDVALQLSLTLNKNIDFSHKSSVSGGCINQCCQLTDTANKTWFIKTNIPERLDMFVAEAEGLNEIRQTNTIRAPKPYLHGRTKEFSYLVLESIALSSRIYGHETGKQLAEMHRATSLVKNQKRFGWKFNNTIGSSLQSNTQHKTWPSFYQNERLLPQLESAKNIGYSSKAYEDGVELANNIEQFFTQYAPKPSLLHGDLWSGNCGSDQNKNPIIFDPAVYYGDRESDIAMTELFGGFSSDFYASYNNEYPLDQGYGVRKVLYNLYHVLNHYNIFGGSYAQQAENMIKKLLAELQ